MLVYAPDAPPNAPGRVFAGNNFRPYDDGLRSVPTLQPYGWAAPAQQLRTLYGCELPDGTGRLYAAALARIYQYTITAGPTYTITDVSKGGVDYTITAAPTKPDGFSNVWQFTNFGSVVLATNGQCSLPIQKQTAGGAAFSDLAGAPSAACIEVFKNFVVCGNITGTYGAVTGTGDMVAWSALGDYTNFVPSLATQAGNNRLYDTAGPIVAIDVLGDYCVIYKERAIYLMIYVGGTDIFAFQRITNNTGCRVWANYSTPIVDIGHAHIFVGENDIYMFDGSRPVSLTAGMRSAIGLTTATAVSTITATRTSHNPTEQEIYFWQANGASPAQLVYNYRLNRWGVLNETQPIAVSLSTNLSAISLYNAVDSIVCAGLVADTANSILNYRAPTSSATHAAATIIVGAQGGTRKKSLSKRATPVWGLPPTTVAAGNWYTAKHPYKNIASWTSNAYSPDNTNARIDELATDRWHAVGVGTTGPWAMVDCDMDIKPTGDE